MSTIVTSNQTFSSGGSGNNYILQGSGISLDLLQMESSSVTIHGTGDQVGLLQSDSQITINDQGQSSDIFLRLLSGPVTILDFQKDSHGVVTLYNAGYLTAQQALAAAKPDGHGGTVLGRVDFVGDAHLTAANLSVVST